MKFILTCFLFFFSLLSFAQDKEKYQQIGDSLMELGQTDNLILYFEDELKKHPGDENILRWLGYIHIEISKLDIGEKYYLEALKTNPSCGRCCMNIGRIYAIRNENAKALEFLNKGIKTDPGDADLYAFRANFKEYTGDTYGALSDYNKAVELEPENAENYIQRGIYNMNKENLFLAISDFNKAISLEPTNYMPYYHKANIYYRQQNLDEALIEINKAIELDSSDYSLFTARGAVLGASEENEKAILDYNKAISMNSDEPLPYHNRAMAYYKLEDLDASCLDYQLLKRFIDRQVITDEGLITEINDALLDFCDSNKSSYYYQRGIGYYNKEEYQKAVEIYTVGLKKYPKDGMAWSFKGNAHLKLGEYKQALDCYSLSMENKESHLAQIKLNPRMKEVPENAIKNFYNGSIAMNHLSITECLIALDSTDNALIEINKGLDLTPKVDGFSLELYYNMRGYLYLNMGKFEQALVDFDKSIEINKTFPLPYVNRAIIKICLTENVKVSSLSVKGNLNSQAMGIDWTLPNKSALKNVESHILSALADCNTALELDDKMGYAYYIRGQIKYLQMSGDYCYDFLTARGLGLIVGEHLIDDCGK
jgi:tetratricopeptide (TPR) repeat protein